MAAVIIFIVLIATIASFYKDIQGLSFLKSRIISLAQFQKNDFNEHAKNIHHFLTEKIPYYLPLSDEGKVKFINRVYAFIKNKNFIGADGMQITDEMLVMISAAAVQITFGLKRFRMIYFHTIVVYPEIFYSRPQSRYFKGSTGAGGTIRISWKDFLKGYEDPHDRINLGFHEMTHALELNYMLGNRYDKFFGDYYNVWREAEETERENVAEGKNKFFRRYAGSNLQEFFAVSVENFFEDPSAFQKEMPDLYVKLCILLNQDPSNKNHNDYAFKNIIESRYNASLKRILKVKSRIGERPWHWTYPLAFIGFFLGIIGLMYLSSYIIISTGQILKLVVSIAIVAAILQFVPLVIQRGYNILIYFFYNIMGIGVLTALLVLSLNLFIKISPEKSKDYLIDSYSGEYESSQNKNEYMRSLSLIDPSTGTRQKVNIYYDNFVNLAQISYVRLYTCKGLFGFENIIKAEFVKTKDD